HRNLQARCSKGRCRGLWFRKAYQLGGLEGGNATDRGHSKDHGNRGFPKTRGLLTVAAQDSGHTRRELFHAIDGRLSESDLPAQETLLGNPRQTFGVPAWVRRPRQHRVVTSYFAVERQLALDPPHRRMEKQNRLDQLLDQVAPVVPSLQVS